MTSPIAASLALVVAARHIEQLQALRVADLQYIEQLRQQNIALTSENRTLRDAAGKDAP